MSCPYRWKGVVLFFEKHHLAPSLYNLREKVHPKHCAFCAFCILLCFLLLHHANDSSVFIPIVKYTDRVTRFTQFHVLGLSFSQLIYISNDSSPSSLSLLLKSSLPLKSEKKHYGYCTGHVIIKCPWIKEICKSVTYLYPVSVIRPLSSR